MSQRRFRPSTDSAQHHRDWLDLVEVSGPFLSLPVLRNTWPSLDSLDKATAGRLRAEHATWQADPAAGQRAWIEFVLRELLGWGEALHTAEGGAEGDAEALAALAKEVPEHETSVTPAFALTEPDGEVTPERTRLLGLVSAPGTHPTARIPGEAWAATPVDRMALLCRQHDVQLGLVTDGRWWALVWAPRGGVTTTAVFDAVSWPERQERDVVRAFVSLLCRTRFFGVPEDETLPKLLEASKDSQEDITEALGVQVRQAVELLVAAIGRADTAQRRRGEPGLRDVPASEVYQGAVSVMMRIVFVLFAEERRLLPSDNDLYAQAYSAGRLHAELQQRALDGSEDELENTHTAWHRLLALFDAVHSGVDHPRLRLHPHDGSLFRRENYDWLPYTIDDRTVLHMLAAVQHVWVGRGKSRERRTVSFRSLDVEQIGYVYEGLLSYDGFRADDVVVGLIGKEGNEAEVGLAELEELAAKCPDVPTLAKKLSEEHKKTGIGSPKALEKALVPPAAQDREEARKKLLSVTAGDPALAERLLPFHGIIRTDLRDLPVVIMPGELFVTESPLRSNSGTHYTPRFLAEEVVHHALEPLVYEPGPLQTAESGEWKLKSSEDILKLKVADIAMGSAAFLVAAARYLGDKLIEAWTRENSPEAREAQPENDLTDADEDKTVIKARRLVIEHCLYGVDINPMAVEMAKLSLWLVSMDPKLPFTFVDDRLVCGDSLLGITSLEQVEYMHMDPKKGREIHERSPVDFTAGPRELVGEVAAERRTLADIDGSTIAGLDKKRTMLEDAKLKTGRVRLFADLAVGAALAHAGRGEKGLRDGSIAAADYARRIDTAEMEARQEVRQWLATDLPDGGFRREPLHWPLVFPEVFEQGGFDAVIGNPPFLGGKKLSGSLGPNYREYLIQAIARQLKGHADLIAYFSLRGHELLDPSGQAGLIATNTLAQGDTREVGLDQLVADGVTIRRSIKSEKWPSRSAALEYAAVWTSRAPLPEQVPRIADGTPVSGITTSLDPASRVTGKPHRLAANTGLAFIGSYILGMGFTMEPEHAHELIARDPRNRDVLFPYLNGQDLNTDPDGAASRWVINFHDWTEDQAKKYEDCFNRVVQLVKPDRQRRKPNGEFTLRNPLPERYWQYADKRPALQREISRLNRVVVVTLVSKTVMPAMVPTRQVFSHALSVFATEDTAMLALLSSAPHYWWAISRASTMKADLRYTPSDVFETFPRPELTPELRELGDRLDTRRREIMHARKSGITKTYNLVFDPIVTDPDIVELRELHRAIDEATVRSYGWHDLLDQLDYGFHPAGADTRFTIGPTAQREILDRLLELNHERYAEEVAQGLHDKKGKNSKSGSQGTLL